MRRPGLASLLLLAAGAVRADDAKLRLDFYRDPLPPGAVMRMGTMRLRVGGPVVAVAADNKAFVARDTENKRLVLWDVASGLPLRALEGEVEEGKVAFSADGKEVIVVGAFGFRA